MPERPRPTWLGARVPTCPSTAEVVVAVVFAASEPVAHAEEDAGDA